MLRRFILRVGGFNIHMCCEYGVLVKDFLALNDSLLLCESRTLHMLKDIHSIWVCLLDRNTYKKN